MNLLKLISAGHPSTNDPNKVHNMVVAGLDEAAHVANPDHAVQTIIDEAQKVGAQIQPELEHVASIRLTNPVSAVSHTWPNHSMKQTPIDHIHIPVADPFDSHAPVIHPIPPVPEPVAKVVSNG